MRVTQGTGGHYAARKSTTSNETKSRTMRSWEGSKGKVILVVMERGKDRDVSTARDG